MAEDSYLHRILENYDETVDLKKEIEQHVRTVARYMATVSQMVQQLADKDAEIVRLQAEVERIEGQRKLRADLAYLMKAERDDEKHLADELAYALKMVLHDRPSAHTDDVWAVINRALNIYEEARRG